MKIIYTKKNEEILVSDEWYEELNSVCWHLNSKGYPVHNINFKNEKGRWSSKLILMHRYVMNLTFERGYAIIVDHIDHSPTNNQTINLRICTVSQNQFNCGRRECNTVGYKGVCKHHGKYQARASLNGKRTSIGHFSTPELASAAYQKFAKEHHGEFYHE